MPSMTMPSARGSRTLVNRLLCIGALAGESSAVSRSS
jgi:hypothetical protein